jgi:hypothetical protein
VAVLLLPSLPLLRRLTVVTRPPLPLSRRRIVAAAAARPLDPTSKSSSATLTQRPPRPTSAPRSQRFVLCFVLSL